MLMSWLSGKSPKSSSGPANGPRLASLRLEALEERCTPTVTFTVNTLADTSVANLGIGTGKDSNGNVSLRSALQEADVTFDNVVIQMKGLKGTISLESSLPVLDNSMGMYINNDTGSSGLTVMRDSSAGNFNLFTVAPRVTATIGGLTLRNGLVPDGFGGAILNYGNLTVSACNIIANGANSGGGIANLIDKSAATAPFLTLIGTSLTNNWAISGNGGAIYNEGFATIDYNSQLSGNTAHGSGGAIYNNAGMTINNSAIGNNTAVSGNGGGISDSGMLTVQNSTVSNNNTQADGGKGGGLYLSGSATMTDTTIGSNTASLGSGIWVVVDTPFTFSGICSDNVTQIGPP